MHMHCSRRGFVHGALLSIGAVSGGLSAKAALRIPAGPMVLERRLQRSLSDGNEIIVTRDWEIAFGYSTRGIEVAGKQISAKVAAPAALQKLAAVEEGRNTNGLYPLTLSDEGRIMLSGNSDDGGTFEQAVRIAQNMIDNSARASDEKQAARQQLSQMQQAGQSLFSAMPADLFFPTGAPIRSVRPVPLPQGPAGEFELVYSARPAPGAPWLSSAERRITTRIGDNARQSAELWTLKPVGLSTA
jgi:hypothetical protein